MNDVVHIYKLNFLKVTLSDLCVFLGNYHVLKLVFSILLFIKLVYKESAGIMEDGNGKGYLGSYRHMLKSWISR